MYLLWNFNEYILPIALAFEFMVQRSFDCAFFLFWLVEHCHMKLQLLFVQRIQDLPFLLRMLLREIMDPQRTLPLVIKARVYIAVS